MGKLLQISHNLYIFACGLEFTNPNLIRGWNVIQKTVISIINTSSVSWL